MSMVEKSPKAAFWHGTLAALLVTVLGYVFHRTMGWLFWPDIAAQWAFAIVPGEIQSEMIIALGTDAKLLGFYVGIVMQVLMGGIIAVLSPRAHWAHQMIAVGVMIALTAFGFRAVSLAVQLPPMTELGLGLLIASIGYPFFYHLVQYSSVSPSAQADMPDSTAQTLRRRRFISMGGTMLGTLAFWPWIRSDLTVKQQAVIVQRESVSTGLVEAVREGVVEFDALPNVSSWLTPEPEFYYVSKNVVVPQISMERWGGLRIDGMVEEPMMWSLDEITSMTPTTLHSTLECIDFDPYSVAAENLIGNGQWTGVPLRRLLEQTRISADAVDLKLEAADGYVDSLPVQFVMERDDILLVWELNDERLSDTHGFPVRLIVPGQYGMKNIKHLKRIEAVNEDVLGYWQTRGWVDDAPIKTFAKIQSLRTNDVLALNEPAIIGGWAFAGLRGVSKVEVSPDNSATWTEAMLEPQQSPATWVRWAHVWEPQLQGRFGVVARAYDGDGVMQSDIRARAFPSGTEGHHRIWIDVVEAADQAAS
jgi:DMSO/TMAO reductase YedYZ molybdopterin-dependent catalytic subunit